MGAVMLDDDWAVDRRRRAIFAGDLFVFSPKPAALAMAELARRLLEEAFAPFEPTDAQHHMPVDAYAATLATVKPRFIHHPDCKSLIPQLMQELGADLRDVYFDVPRLRSATAHSYLTSGIAYAFHPHRDTWYSAPQAQINWWFPVYEIERDNCLALYQQQFSEILPNSSETYNYYRWNQTGRTLASAQIGDDTRVQPRLTADVSLGPELRLVVPVGSLIVFSGHQLHETVPNSTDVTRFSIDFRTVHRSDLVDGVGAPSGDVHCTGTTLRDFHRCTDMAPLDAELVARYDDESALEYAEGLVFTPSEN